MIWLTLFHATKPRVGGTNDEGRMTKICLGHSSFVIGQTRRATSLCVNQFCKGVARATPNYYLQERGENHEI
jgi:hypothetical protein